MKKRLSSLLAVFCSLVIIVASPIPASAALVPEEDLSPQASAYLTAYTAWAVRSSTNQIYVYYDVTATKTIGCVGAKLIVVQMNDGGTWRPVYTKTGTTSNGMLVLNAFDHGGNIKYQGSSSTQYRAVVTIFGGSSTTSGDSRIVTTNIV